jgi:phospholipid/cholesterol/gamma-HCH transport system ATP-binding protein
MIGLLPPVSGKVFIQGSDIVSSLGKDRIDILRGIGVMYQNGALFGSMNLIENICLVLEEFKTCRGLWSSSVMKLKVVGLRQVL